MASSERGMKGWELVLGEESDGTNLRSVAKSSITLRREVDDLKIKEGDFVVLGSINGTPMNHTIAMIKDIIFGSDRYLIVKVLMMLKRSSLVKEDIPESKDDDIRFETNEVYLTPEMESIEFNDIVHSCNVISAESFKHINLNESNLDTTFVCRRFSDNIGNYFTDIVDWDEMMSAFIENKDEFFSTLKLVTIQPTLKKVTNQFKRQGIDPRAIINNSPRKKVIKRVTKQILGDEDYDLDDNYIYSSSESESDSDLDNIMHNELYDSDEDKPQRSQSPKKRKKSSPRKSPTKKRDILLPELPTVARKLNFDDEDSNNTTKILQKAKKILGTGAQIQSLPCREDEFLQLYHQLETSVLSQHGSCIYVSGTPGVGKTATIREVIKQLSAKLQLENNGNKLFNYVEINGLKLVSPQAAYEVLWKKISGKQSSANTALSNLQTHFESTIDAKSRLPLVVLLDELDQIVTRNQTVMYNFFNWPSFEYSKLIVVAVANTMDLPERLLTNKISSRLGLTRIQFSSYTYDQLSQIIKHRLDNLSKSNDKLIIAKDAIEFASRKVASVSGDARRSLMICIRAVELAELEFLNKSKKERKELDGKYTVTIMHIMKAINETASSPISNYLYSLSFMSKMVLASILLRKKRTGLAEIQLGELIDELNNQFQVLLFTDLKKSLKDEGMEFLDTMYGSNNGLTTRFRVNGFSYILKEFEEAGILVMQQVKAERNKLLRLNISDDEILTCFRKDTLLKELISIV